MAIRINNLTKSFDDKLVLHDLSITIEKGMIHTILGPSGCGKSTLLNIINGTLIPDAGDFEIHDELISQVFQEHRLLPWKTITENIEYVISGHKDKHREEVKELIRQVGLKGSEEKYPHQLSGGMQQRCALARAFALNASTIILDEPFKGLDQKIKRQMIALLVKLWKQQKGTIIFVTHDVDEALAFSHHINLLSDAPAKVIYNTTIKTPLEDREKLSDELLSIKNTLTGLINL